MLRTRELTTRAAGTDAAQAAPKALPSGIFPCKYKGWSGLKHPLTCRQGDFAEDLSEQGR
jgi:hypothetical protein